MIVVTQSRAVLKCELHIPSPPDPGLGWPGLGLVTPSCHLNLNTVYIFTVFTLDHSWLLHLSSHGNSLQFSEVGGVLHGAGVVHVLICTL